MSQFVVARPLDESDAHDDLRPHPMLPHAWQAGSAREWRAVDFGGAKSRPQIGQQRGVESGADLSGEDEIVAVEIPDEERAESDATALRIGEAADDKVLLELAFHLEPQLRAPLLVWRVESLGDDALPAFVAGAFPRLGVSQRRYTHEWGAQWQGREARSSF